ncbi:hypothetical protein SSX86_016413 [Deinandra increscens subsp. villosa]|uniref:Uncharacterized protein n=1 Tax=Deinandra increscens subsp. villosa TaxID=3103831 RepID=A0AAP0D2M7_9ASTR
MIEKMLTIKELSDQSLLEEHIERLKEVFRLMEVAKKNVVKALSETYQKFPDIEEEEENKEGKSGGQSGGAENTSKPAKVVKTVETDTVGLNQYSDNAERIEGEISTFEGQEFETGVVEINKQLDIKQRLVWQYVMACTETKNKNDKETNTKEGIDLMPTK